MLNASPPSPGQNSLTAESEGPELAQAGAGSGPAIGEVSSVTGTVFITHPDGTKVKAADGTPIFQGDVVETTDDGAIGLTFADDTTFSLAEGGQMTIDEMVYDASTQTGKAAFGISQGVFTFVSGQISKTAVDAMTLNTPLATIGIRGTAGGGKVGPEGTQNTFSSFSEAGGVVGEMVITTLGGTQTLSGGNQTTQFSSSYVPPTIPVALPPAAAQVFYSRAAAAAPQPVIAPAPTFAPGSTEAKAAQAAQAAFQNTIEAGGSLDDAISGAVDVAAKTNFEAVLADNPLQFGTPEAQESVIEGEKSAILAKVVGARADPLGAGKGDGPGFSNDFKDSANQGLGHVLKTGLANNVENILDVFAEGFFEDSTGEFFENFVDDPFGEFGFEDPFDEFFVEDFFFEEDIGFEEDIFFFDAFIPFDDDIDDFFQEIVIFGDEFDLTSGDDDLLGGVGNTEFILDQGLFGNTVYGGNDIINDSGGTRDRITFEGVDLMVASVTGDSVDTSRVDINIALLTGPVSIVNTGVTSALSSPVNRIDVSKNVEDLQALDSTFTNFDSGGILLFGALDVTSSQTGYLIAGGSADDTIDLSGFSNSATTIGSIIFGKGGNDTLTGTINEDDLLGGAGNDTLDGNGGTNFLEGGFGNDTLNVTVASSTNALDGDDGDDTFNVSASSTNILNGGFGNDTFNLTGAGGVASSNNINGGSGTDTLDYSALTTTVTTYNFGSSGSLSLSRTSGGNDTVSGIESMISTGGDDTFNFSSLSLNFTNIDGSAGNDSFIFNSSGAQLGVIIDGGANGGSGDRITLNAGTSLSGTGGVKNVETITGSSGNDTIKFIGAQSGVTVDLNAGIDTVTLDNAVNSLTISDTESITGGSANDTITLGAAQGSGTIDLAGGTDALTLANGGNTLTVFNTETITGGTGNDIITVDAADIDTINPTFNGNTGTGDKLIITASASVDLVASELAGITNFEALTLGSNQSYTVVLNTANAGTAALAIDATAVTTGGNLVKVDAAAETDGGTIQLTVAGSALDTGGTASVLTGGAGSDSLKINSTGALTLDATELASVSAFETWIIGSAQVYTLTLASGNAVSNALTINTNTAALNLTANNSGQTITVDATSLANNTALTVAAASQSALTVTNLVGNVVATNLTGALTVTTADNTVDNGVSITTGSAAVSLTANNSGDTVTVNAAALAQNTALTVSAASASALTVTNLVGNVVATNLTGVLTVTTADAGDNAISITSGSGAMNLTANNATDTVTVDATALAQNTALTVSAASASNLTVTGLVGDIVATNLTGVLTVTTADAGDNAISITSGSGAMNLTANFATDTVTVNAAALANDTALTVAATSASNLVVTNLIGDIVATNLSGTLTVTTAQNTVDNDISITAGTGNLTVTASAAGTIDDVIINAAAMTGSQTITVGSGTVNFITVNNWSSSGALDASALTGGTAHLDVTVTGTAATNITGTTTATDDSVILGSGINIDFSGGTLSNIDEITFDSGGNTVTVSTANMAAVRVVTGGAGTDILKLADASTALNLATNSVAFTNSVAIQLGTGGDNLTVAASQLDSATEVTAITGGAGADTLTLGASGTFTLANTLLTAVATIVYNSGGNTLTVNAADLNDVTAVTGGAGNDTLTLADTDNLTAITFTNVENLTFGDFSVSIDTTNVGEFTAITGGSTSGTLVLEEAAAFNFTSTTLAGELTLNMNGTAKATTVTLSTANMDAIAAITGDSGTAQKFILTGTDDISGANGTTFTNIETMEFGNFTVTLDAADVTAFSTAITGTGGSGVLVLNEAAAFDFTSTLLTGVITLSLNGTLKATSVKVDAADLNNVTTVIGASGTAQTLILNDTDDLTGITFTNIETLLLANAATVTLTAAQLGATSNAFTTAVTGSSGGDTLTLGASGAFTLANTLLTLVETLTFNSGGNTLTVDTADMADVTTVTGGAGNDVLRLSNASTALNLATNSVAFTNSVKIQLGTGGDNLTVAASQLDSATEITDITGGSGTDTLTLGASGTFTLANTALTAVETIVYNSGGNTLSLSAADIADVTTVTGGAGADTITALDSANVVGKTFTSIETVSLSDGVTITFDSTTTADEITAVSGASGGSTENLINSSGNDDITGITFTDITLYTLSQASAAQTLTVDSSTAFGGMDVTGTQTSSANDDLITSAADIDLSSVVLTNIATVTIDSDSNSGSTVTLTMNSTTDLNGANVATGTSNAAHLHISSGAGSGDTALDLSGSSLFVNSTNVLNSLLLDSAGNTAGAVTLTANAATDFAAGGSSSKTEIREFDGSSVTAVNIVSSANGLNFNDVVLVDVATVNLDTGNGGAFKLLVNSNTNLDDATIVGQGSNDTINLADGGTTISFANNTLTDIFEIVGGTGNDSITGSGGADSISGLGGADTLDGGAGNDTFEYDATADLFASNTTVDTAITGGAGTDSISINNNGGATFNITASDVFNGVTGIERIEAGEATNQVISIILSDSVAALGITTVDLSLDTDATATNTVTVDGFAFTNVIDVGAETATGYTLTGSSGADNIHGGDGADTISGGDGNDTIFTDGGADTVTGGNGDDTFLYDGDFELFGTGTGGSNLIANSINGNAGTDVISIEGDSAFTIVATDDFTGISNVEKIVAFAANTNVISITLEDDASLSGLTAVDLSGDTSATGANVIDVSAETSVAYTLTGSAGNDDITGGAGNDTINAGAGSDNNVAGRGGADILTAGNALDHFEYLTTDVAAAGATTVAYDTINGFTSGTTGSTIDWQSVLSNNGTAIGASNADLGTSNFLSAAISNSVITAATDTVGIFEFTGGTLGSDIVAGTTTSDAIVTLAVASLSTVAHAASDNLLFAMYDTGSGAASSAVIFEFTDDANNNSAVEAAELQVVAVLENVAQDSLVSPENFV